jgi:hypothetical protein
MPRTPASARRPAALKAAGEEAQPAKMKTAEPPPTTIDEMAKAAQLEDIAAKRPVIVKLARIMAGLPDLAPEGKNPHFGYDFIKDTQVSGTLRGRLAKERLMIIPEVLSEEMREMPTRRGMSYLTKLKIRFTVIDGDSGDSVSGTGVGYGDDAGDKGANKAFTSALKYWLLKLFQIGGEDSENDQRADERASGRVAGPTEVKVEGAKIEGVARGGKSDKITEAQRTQMMTLYRELELTPRTFAGLIDIHLGEGLEIDESHDVNEQLRRYVANMTADDAGKLISGMADEKDTRGQQEAAAEGGGYG